MKQFAGKAKGLIKGTPIAVLLSVVFHTLLIVGAGAFVVFKIVDRQEKKFVPPAPVERPKLDLKKPRVKIRKTAKPRSLSRITANSVSRAMPEIQLPDVSSFGAGLSGGLSGFEMMPDLSEMTMFGSKKSMAIGNDLEGTFYALRLDRRGRESGISTYSAYLDELRKFVESGWNPNALARYYRAPQKLYATQLMIPPHSSDLGPSQFGMGFGSEFDPIQWCVHYKGKFAYKKGGRMRFAGFGDDVFLVRVNGKEVFNAGWAGPESPFQDITDFRNSSEENRKYVMGISWMSFGDWFDLEAGEPADLEILLGDNGGIAAFMLLVQEAGVTYEKNRVGAPILPIFKTTEMPDMIRHEIEYTLIEGEADLEGGPVFNVY